MTKTILLPLLVGIAVFCGCEGGVRDSGEASPDWSSMTLEEAHKILEEKIAGDLTIDAKLTLAMEFLEAFPESEHTVDVFRDVVYYRGVALDDWEHAIAFAEQIRAQVSGPDIALVLDKAMIGFYGKAGMKGKMLSLADSLEAAGLMRFNDYWDVIEAVVELEEWDLTREYCRKARGLANAATFRADWPDYEVTDEEAERAGLNRKGMLLTMDSWARANLGQVDEALEDFTRAAQYVRSNYLGIPDYDCNRFWANTLMMKEDYLSAIEKYAPEALIAHDEAAFSGLKKAYVGVYGSEVGYDAFAEQLRKRIAKKIDDFDLPDFSGMRRQYSDLKDDVTLLVFWSPT